MQDQNPEMVLNGQKQQTIEEYINENMHLKTLKIKKFEFSDSFSSEAKSFRGLKNSQTSRQKFNLTTQRYTRNLNQWEPKLSHRKILNEPKILISVERRKIKTCQVIKKANEIFFNSKTRLGFRGQKVRTHSFFNQKSEQKISKKFILENNKTISPKKYKLVPNFHFNLNYIKDHRKNEQKYKSIETKTKTGSNKGYLTFFGSDNFTKYLESKSHIDFGNVTPTSYLQLNKAEERKHKAKNKIECEQKIKKQNKH